MRTRAQSLQRGPIGRHVFRAFSPSHKVAGERCRIQKSSRDETCVPETRAFHPETGTINPRAHSTQHRPPWHTPHPYPIHTPVAALSSAPHLVPSQNYTSSNKILPSNDAHRSRCSGCGSQLWLSSTSFARAAAYPLPTRVPGTVSL